ncbi:MAG: hypothetical protein M0P59_06175 [Gallionella sp.]|jgi:hypothetical protein|nr:hypothetical protein [Gallionella sp.]MCK9353729.1 hypothetical protein [Gallionella sp.]
MAIEKKVLLARPHAFIVSEMRPFLERNGYQPTKLESIDDMHSGKLGSFSGAIISTAVVSSIAAKPAEVFAELRKRYPSLPVIFAGLTAFDSTLSTIQRIVHEVHPGSTILPFNARAEEHSRLGERDVFLFLNKDDIASAAAERILRQHFR